MPSSAEGACGCPPTNAFVSRHHSLQPSLRAPGAATGHAVLTERVMEISLSSHVPDEERRLCVECSCHVWAGYVRVLDPRQREVRESSHPTARSAWPVLALSPGAPKLEQRYPGVWASRAAFSLGPALTAAPCRHATPQAPPRLAAGGSSHVAPRRWRREASLAHTVIVAGLGSPCELHQGRGGVACQLPITLTLTPTPTLTQRQRQPQPQSDPSPNPDAGWAASCRSASTASAANKRWRWCEQQGFCMTTRALALQLGQPEPEQGHSRGKGCELARARANVLPTATARARTGQSLEPHPALTPSST